MHMCSSKNVRFGQNWLPWWLRWQRICLHCGRPGFNLWVGKILWRREWQSTPVFLPGGFHGQWSLVGYSSRGCRVRHDWATTLRNHKLGNLRTKLLQNSSRFKPRLILFIHTQKVNPYVCLWPALCLSLVSQPQTETVYFLENCFE